MTLFYCMLSSYCSVKIHRYTTGKVDELQQIYKLNKITYRIYKHLWPTKTANATTHQHHRHKALCLVLFCNSSMPRSSNKAAQLRQYVCPNANCIATFKTKKGANHHFSFYCTSVGVKANRSMHRRDASMDDNPFAALSDSDANDIFDDVASIDNSGNELDVLNTQSPLQVASKRKSIHKANHDYYPTKLLKLLEDANAPHSLYSEICAWAREANANNYDFNPSRTSRPAQIDYLIKWQNLKHCLPYQVPITFPEDNLRIQVTKFDFTAQLYSLLTDAHLTGSLDQLDVNVDNPFDHYKPPDGLLGPFNSGSWYRKAWKHLCQPGSNDWLCPIIFGCDETLVGSHLGRASVTPLVFTLSIFNEGLRNRPCAWRPLGYVYDMNQHGKAMNTEAHADKIRKMKPQEKCSRYHMILKEILRELVTIQQQGGIKGVTVQLGPYKKEHVNIKVPVAMILGDMQGGDKHCGSVVGYSKNMARLCRQCNISGEESGDPLIQCKKMSMTKIKQYVLDDEAELLKSISQNNVYCAWFDVDFGGCERGIFSAAMPVEALHAIEGGLCKDVVSILFTMDLKPMRCGQLDILARRMCSWDKQFYLSSGSNKAMPRLLFKDGITCLTKIASSYIVGIMLSVVVISLTDDGKAFFETAFQSEYSINNNRASSIDGLKRGATKRLNDMRYVFSMMLCYWSWLKQPTYWNVGDKEACKKAENAIQVMLKELIRLWPRAEGNGWFKPKVHEQKHVPGDIHRNGSPRNSYSGPVEHNHLDVKKQAKRTQMHREKLDAQIGARAAESYVIDYCYQKMLTNDLTEAPPTKTAIGKSTRSSHGIITLSRGPRCTMAYTFQWSQSTPIDGIYSHTTLQCIADSFYSEFYSTAEPLLSLQLQVFTDYKRHDIIFRAHPNYRKGRPWHDWAMIRYTKTTRDIEKNKCYKEKTHLDEVYYGDDIATHSNFHYAPGKLMAFVELPDNSIKAVVESCSYEHIKSGVFSTYWKIEYTNKARTNRHMALIEADSLVRQMLMIPENDNEDAYHEIWDVERWSREFV